MTSQLIINEPPLQLLPSLATKVGLNEALILQQVHYWLNPKFNKNHHQGRLWVWNTYEQWQQQFPFWCAKTISRTIISLEKLGLLDSFVTSDFRKHKYYTINYQKLDQLSTKTQKSAENKVSHPSGQNVPTEWTNCPDRAGQIVPIEEDKLSSAFMEKTAENQGSHPSGQNVPIEWTNCPDRRGQTVPIHQDKLSRSNTENTSETTPLPPLTPPSPICPSISVGKDEEEEFEKMILVWNETVQGKLQPGQKVFLTPKRLSSLKEFLATVLQGKASAWEDYCGQIANSRFLLGENPSGFKVTLDWALTPVNAYKVLEGAIYDKPTKTLEGRTVDPTVEELLAEVRENALVGPLSENWLKVCPALIKSLGLVVFRSWFLKVGLFEVSQDFAVVHVEGSFKKNYIETNFGFDLRQALQSLYPSVKYVRFQMVSSRGESA